MNKKILITYLHYDRTGKHRQLTRRNVDFFLHAGYFASDLCHFNIVINGRNSGVNFPDECDNLSIIRRDNSGHDWGGYGESIVNTNLDDFEYFIFLNDTCRGPFLPSFVKKETWPDLFVKDIDSEVKIVGPAAHNVTLKMLAKDKSYFALDGELMVANDILTSKIGKPRPHGHPKRMPAYIQSWGFGMDRKMLDLMQQAKKFNTIGKRKRSIVLYHEMGMCNLARRNNYKIKSFQLANNLSKDKVQLLSNVNANKKYYGINASPFEMMFVKYSGPGYESAETKLYSDLIMAGHPDWKSDGL